MESCDSVSGNVDEAEKVKVSQVTQDPTLEKSDGPPPEEGTTPKSSGNALFEDVTDDEDIEEPFQIPSISPSDPEEKDMGETLAISAPVLG